MVCTSGSRNLGAILEFCFPESASCFPAEFNVFTYDDWQEASNLYPLGFASESELYVTSGCTIPNKVLGQQ